MHKNLDTCGTSATSSSTTTSAVLNLTNTASLPASSTPVPSSAPPSSVAAMWSYAGCVADNGNRVLTGSSLPSVSPPVAISLVSRAESSSALQQELAQIHEERERLKKLIELDQREEQLRKRAKKLAEGQSGSTSTEV
jgi:hypothetical protein